MTFQPLRADLTDLTALRKEVNEALPTHVLHLAAISFVGHVSKNAFYDVNLFGTLNLLDALSDLSPKPVRVILASSANVYGNCLTSPISEDQIPAPINHYAVSKLAMEHMSRTYSDCLSVSIARPFNYTGPGQDSSFVVPKLVDHFSRRAPVIQLGDLSVEREFNDVSMVCDAYLNLLSHAETNETYNICSGMPHTLQEVIDILVDLTGHMPHVAVNPAFVRANEVRRLCGNPTKFSALLSRQGKKIVNPSLRQTLVRMLEAASL